MNSNIKIPKFCQYCGQAFVAQTTTTRFCGHKCASTAYKQRKREEKVQTTLSDQIKSVTSANSENLQSLPIKTGNFLNLRDKEFLSVQEAEILVGASRWTIQRMIQRDEIKTGKLGRRQGICRN